MPTRREVVRAGVVAGAPWLVGGTAARAAPERLRPEALLRGDSFGLGVSAGQPRTDAR